MLGELKKKGAMTNERYDELRPTGTQPSVLYGLGKVHKPVVNNIPKLRPIPSAINTPTLQTLTISQHSHETIHYERMHSQRLLLFCRGRLETRILAGNG